jgi:nucleotide-binding universal stress UspA family protein
MAGFATESGGRTTTHIAEGRPYEQIVRLATEQDVDLIVIGTSVHSSLFGGTPVLGPEIERVVRNAPCPVLSVPTARVVTPIPALVTEPIPQM